MLHLYRWHTKLCPTPRNAIGAASPIYVKGTLREQYIKKSLDLTSWDAAQSLIAAWTDSGEIGVVKAETPTVKGAVEKFFEDARARHLGWETMRKYQNLLDTRFLGWCETKGIRLLK